jgi:hypothetical protein
MNSQRPAGLNPGGFLRLKAALRCSLKAASLLEPTSRRTPLKGRYREVHFKMRIIKMRTSKLLGAAVVTAAAMIGAMTVPALSSTTFVKKTFHNYGGREMALTVTDKLQGGKQVINTTLKQGGETSGFFQADSQGKLDLVWRGTFGGVCYTAERTDKETTPVSVSADADHASGNKC